MRTIYVQSVIAQVLIADVMDEAELCEEELRISEQVMSLELSVEYELLIYYFGTEAVMHLPNGDPGYPAEGPEYELHLKSDVRKLLRMNVSHRVFELLDQPVQDFLDIIHEQVGESAMEAAEQTCE